MRRNLDELQNYLEYLYQSVDDETEKVEMSVEVMEDLREFFNACILSLVETTGIQNSLVKLCFLSLLINVILVAIFVFKI
jgi:hypothetical protein